MTMSHFRNTSARNEDVRNIDLRNENGHDTRNEDVQEERKPVRKQPEESQIVHRVNGVDPKTGQPKVFEHGPMPVSEWADYEKEHNL